MLALPTSRHLLQFVPQPALSQVPGQRTPSLAGGAPRRTATHTLRACGLHAAARVGTPGTGKPESCLLLTFPARRPDVAGVCAGPSPVRRRNRLLRRAAHLESETGAPSPHSLRGSRRWNRSGRHWLGAAALRLVPAGQGNGESVPRQVSGWVARSFRRGAVALSRSDEESGCASRLRSSAAPELPPQVGSLCQAA